MTVAIRVVDSIDRTPIFVADQSGWVTTKRSRIGPFPFFVYEIEPNMRCIFEWIVSPWHVPFFDISDLSPDRDHCGTEPIDFRFRFRFGRLNHQRARNWEAHGGRVETVVD
jgi:hypothetical protein